MSPILTMATLAQDGRRMNRRDLHAVIAYATSTTNGVRTLWAQPDRDHVLIQSAEAPRTEHLAHIMAPLSAAARSLDYREGVAYRLTVDANPATGGGKHEGRGRQATPTTDYAAWLTTRLRDCAVVRDVIGQGRAPLRIKHPTGGMVTLARAIIAATVTVTDPVAMTRLALCGIGHGRAYGLGLMLTQEVMS